MVYAIHVKSGGKDFYLADNRKTFVWGITFTPNINHAKVFNSESSASARLCQLNRSGYGKGVSIKELSGI